MTRKRAEIINKKTHLCANKAHNSRFIQNLKIIQGGGETHNIIHVYSQWWF